MNWVNTVNRIERIKEMIIQNNEYYQSVVGNEYIIDDFGTIAKIDSFDKETLMFKLTLVNGYKVWWDGAEDFMRNTIANQYLYKL